MVNKITSVGKVHFHMSKMQPVVHYKKKIIKLSLYKFTLCIKYIFHRALMFYWPKQMAYDTVKTS